MSDDKMPELLPCCHEWLPQISILNGMVGGSFKRQGGIAFRFCPWCGQEKQANTRTVSPAVPLDDFITSEAGAIYKEGLERIWKMSDTKMDVPKSKVIATLQGVAHHHLTQGNAANDFYRFDPDATPPAASGARTHPHSDACWEARHKECRKADCICDCHKTESRTETIRRHQRSGGGEVTAIMVSRDNDAASGAQDDYQEMWPNSGRRLKPPPYKKWCEEHKQAPPCTECDYEDVPTPAPTLCIDCHHNNLVGQYCAEIVESETCLKCGHNNLSGDGHCNKTNWHEDDIRAVPEVCGCKCQFSRACGCRCVFGAPDKPYVCDQCGRSDEHTPECPTPAYCPGCGSRVIGHDWSACYAASSAPDDAKPVGSVSDGYTPTTLKLWICSHCLSPRLYGSKEGCYACGNKLHDTAEYVRRDAIAALSSTLATTSSIFAAIARLEENESWWRDLVNNPPQVIGPYCKANFEARAAACRQTIEALQPSTPAATE